MPSIFIRRYIATSILFAIAFEPQIMGSRRQSRPGGDTGPPGTAIPTLNRPFPFEQGEVLTYNIVFSKLLLSGSIGQLKLTVRNNQATVKKDPMPAKVSAAESQSKASSGPKSTDKPQTQTTTPPNSPEAKSDTTSIEFGAEVASKGFFTWLFGIKIEHRYGAVIGS